MARAPGDRLAVIGDAAIEVLAARGARGLTHRAVDEAAGLPAGSTSYYARTRAALLEVTIARLAEVDIAPAAETPWPTDVGTLARMLAAMVADMMGPGRTRSLARYELALEAVRHPRLRAALEHAGVAFRQAAAALLASLGSADPERHGRLLVACCDGIVFDALVGAGSARPPTPTDLEAHFTDLLAALLPSPGARPGGRADDPSTEN